MTVPSLLAVAVARVEKPWLLLSQLQSPSQHWEMEVGKGSQDWRFKVYHDLHYFFTSKIILLFDFNCLSSSLTTVLNTEYEHRCLILMFVWGIGLGVWKKKCTTVYTCIMATKSLNFNYDGGYDILDWLITTYKSIKGGAHTGCADSTTS